MTTMNSAERRKLEQVQAMTTEALRRIIDHAERPGGIKATPDMPLAGNVTISGIGMVSVKMLRNVVDSR
jgi:hypothetical protein